MLSEDSWQLAVGSGQWAVGSWLLAVGCGLWAVGCYWEDEEFVFGNKEAR